MATVSSISLFSVLALFAAAGAQAAEPRLFFSDLESGPNSGGEKNAGAYVTVYGKRFGAAQGSSTVTIGGGGASAYPVWTDTKITFQLGTAAASGGIVVTTAAGKSNPVPFTVRRGNIRFVAINGNDSSDGTFGKPWKTMPHAVQTITAGDIIYAMNGVRQIEEDGQGWNAAITLRSEWCTGSVARALVAYPGATVLAGARDGSPNFGVRTTDSSGGGGACQGNWVFAGLSLTSLAGMALAGGSHWRIVGNDFTCPNGDGGGACFESNQANYLQFYGNNVHDAGKIGASALYHGVYFSTDSSHIDMGWNTISNVHGCRGLQVHSSPLGNGGPSDPTGRNQFDLSIHDNVIHDTQCDGMILATIDPSKGKVEVYNNIIYDAGKGPNNPEQTGGWACINIAGTTNNGVEGGGMVEVFQNTMYNCGTFRTPPYANSNAGVVNNAGNGNLKVRVRNNVFYQAANIPPFVSYIGTQLCTGSTPCPGIFGSNNLFFNTPLPGNPNITKSTNKDPGFVNLAAKDFHLTAGSAAKGAGVDLGPAADMDGYPRGGTAGYDLGAFQFAAPAIAAINCALPAIVTPGIASCEVILTEAAASPGGVQLSLSSDTPALTMPATLSIDGGSAHASIQLISASVSTRMRANVSVTMDGRDVTVPLWLLPAGSPLLISVSNAASFAATSLSPGSMITAFGLNLGPANPAAAKLNAQGRVDTELNGTVTLFDGHPAALVYVAASQVSALVPYGLPDAGSLNVEISVRGRLSNPILLPVQSSSPGIFTANSSGKGQVLAFNEDGTINGRQNPAHRGSVVVFYAVGLGETNPGGVDGQIASIPPSLPLSEISVQINGLAAEVLYAGSTFGSIAGVFQLNVRVPLTSDPGEAVPLSVSAAGVESQTGATIATE